MQAAFKFVLKPLRKQSLALTKANSTTSASSGIAGDERRMAAIAEQESRYLGYLSDPGAIVDWNDVIELVYTPPTSLTSTD